MMKKNHTDMNRNKVLLTASISLLLWAASGYADSRCEIAFPDIAGYTTLKCDFHMHTVFSDGKVWPDVRVEEAWREGLDAIAITDHIEYLPHKGDIPKNLDRPFEIAGKKAEELGILLIKGAEMTFDTPPGHFNAIFVQDIAALEAKVLLDEAKNAHQQGGFIFWNHPDWQGHEKGQWIDLYTTMVQDGLMNGIEICNGSAYYSRAHQWCLEKNLTMVGNTDIHGPSMRLANTDKDHRTMTLVFAKEKSLAAIKEALQNGRTAVWCEDKLIGKKEFLEPLFYASVTIQNPLPSNNDIVVDLHNRSEISITLDRKGDTGPKTIVLGAKGTTRVKFPLQTEPFVYTVKNFLIAPEKGLPIKLDISTVFSGKTK
ncbi:MAG: histidinol-phosphatase [Planctomycetes bacterium]|nr:histidinol-phosphatase [Planctomycetota bacterium]